MKMDDDEEDEDDDGWRRVYLKREPSAHTISQVTSSHNSLEEKAIENKCTHSE